MAKVPDLTTDALDQIIRSIHDQAQITPGEYEELDLSQLSTLADQLAHIKQQALSRPGRG